MMSKSNIWKLISKSNIWKLIRITIAVVVTAVIAASLSMVVAWAICGKISPVCSAIMATIASLTYGTVLALSFYRQDELVEIGQISFFASTAFCLFVFAILALVCIALTFYTCRFFGRTENGSVDGVSMSWSVVFGTSIGTYNVSRIKRKLFPGETAENQAIDEA